MSALVVAVLAVAAALLWPPPRGAARASGGARRERSTTRRAAEPTAASSADIAEVARLLGTALRGGAGLVEALEVVAGHGPPSARPVLRQVVAAHRWGGSAREAWAPAGERWRPVADALVAAEEAGLSPVRTLDSAAQRLDRARQANAKAAVGRLEVLVVLPLGLAFLPGFVLTTVVPLVAALAAETVAR